MDARTIPDLKGAALKKLGGFLVAATLFLLASLGGAQAQSTCPNLAFGTVLTAAQWNFCFSRKQDTFGYTPVNKAGDTLTGRLTTAPSTTLASGLNVAPGSTPTSPNNGDVWTTTAGIFVRINGATLGPLIGASSASFVNLTVTGTFTATGKVTVADLTSPSVTVNGQTCTLGSSCTITAAATTITVGTTTVASGTTGRVLFNNAGVLGEYTITGTAGSVVLSASPTLSGTVGGSITLSGNNTYSGTALFTGGVPSLANGNGSIAASATKGGLLTGKGSVSDVTIQNGAGSDVCSIATGGTTINCATLTLTNRLGPAYVAIGTSAALGIVQCDGTTITCTAGVITAVGAVSSSIGVGTTTISSGTTTRVLFDNAGVLGEYAISGTGSVCMTTSCAMTTPNIGAATATTINGVTISATSGTLTVASGKTLTANNTVTLSGTDGSTITFGAGGTVLYSGGAAGTPSSLTLTNATGLPLASGVTGTLAIANGGTGDTGTAFPTWSMTPSCQSGAGYTLTLNSTGYKTLGKWVIATFTVNVGTAGSCGGYILITTPTAQQTTGTGACEETGGHITGIVQLSGASSSNALLWKYDGTTFGGVTGNNITCTVSYQQP